MWHYSTYHFLKSSHPLGKVQKSTEVLYLGTEKQSNKGQNHAGHCTTK